MALDPQLVKDTLVRSLKTVETVRPESRQKFANVLYKLFNDHGILMLFYSGTRNYAEQWQLYLKHLAGGPLAAPPGDSWHNFGRAIDSVPVLPGGALAWKGYPNWNLVNQVMNEMGLQHGAKFGDAGHMSDQVGTTKAMERSKFPGWQQYGAAKPAPTTTVVPPPSVGFKPNLFGWLLIGSLATYGGYELYKVIRKK